MRIFFDFKFNDFITTRFIKFIYAFVLIGAALIMLFGGLGAVLLFMQERYLAAFGALVLSPVYALLSILSGRMSLELVIVVFRIAENTQIMARVAEEQARASQALR